MQLANKTSFSIVSTVKNFVLICFIINGLLLITFIKFYMNKEELYDVTSESVKDVLCHYDGKESALPVIGIDFDIEPEAKSIYFIETSCKGTLTYREMCAIESATRANPDYTVYVLFVSDVSKNSINGEMGVLQQFTNVIIGKIDIAKYTAGTPVEFLIQKLILLQSSYPVSHTSDMLRFITLYKYGGIYLDLDVIVAKPFNKLPKNFAGKEGTELIGSSVLGITLDDTGSKIAKEFVQKFATTFQGNAWAKNGPIIISKVLEKICNTSVVKISENSCTGFTVFDDMYFSPYFWDESETIFNPGRLVYNAHTYHIFNKLTKSLQVHKHSPYAKLVKKFCPSIHGTYKYKFIS